MEEGSRLLRARLAPLIATWTIHGVLLLTMAALVGALRRQVHNSEWLELMEAADAWALVKPVQAAVAAVEGMRAGIAWTGLASLIVGGIAWIAPFHARWPLHLCAAAHIILVPWATWVGHVALGETAAHAGVVVSEILTAVCAVAGCVIAMIATERARSAEARSSTEPPPS